MSRILLALYKAGMLVLLLLMSSCLAGRKYARPDLGLPATEQQPGPEELMLADMQWWELYSDQYLQELIEKALQRNKDMEVAAGHIRELAALKRIDNAALLPQVGLTASGDREWEDYRGEKSTAGSQFDTKLTVAWELDLLGNLRWARQKGLAEYLESVEARRALQMTLVAGVAQAYFELIALDNELAIVRQTLSTREEGVRQAKLRFEGGLTSETSYQQAQVELANTATLIPGLVRSISAKENELALLCGEYPGRIDRSGMNMTLNLPARFGANLSSELLMRRPDVQAAEQALIAANASVGMAYTDRFPRIRLTGAYGFETDRLPTILDSPYGLIAGSLASPVFSFNAKRARYRAQQAAYEQQTARFEKTVLTVFHEASDAITAYNAVRQARERKSDLEEAAQKYVDLARLQYINGVISYLDVLDAQRNYFDAQIGLSNAVRDEYITIVNLYKALGGGWELAED